MKNMKIFKHTSITLLIVLLFAFTFSVTAFATGTGDVAGAVESTWSDVSA